MKSFPAQGRLKGFSSVSLLTLVSRISGLARDALMASMFGTGMLLDAFSLAFRLPNLARRLLGDGAMAAAFLPEFVREDAALGRGEATRLLDSVAHRLTRILLAIIIPLEVTLLALRFTVTLSARAALVIDLSALMVPFMLTVCLTALVSAALNSVQRFRVAAFTPVLLNLVWFAGGILAALTIADAVWQVRLIAVSIVTGGVLQLLLSVAAARSAGIPMVWPGRLVDDADLRVRRRRVFAIVLPALAGLSITQINAVVDSGIAWGFAVPVNSVTATGEIDRSAYSTWELPEGTASALYLGQRLFQFPMGVFGIALGTILFPRFARHAAARNRGAFSADVAYGLRLVTVVGIPASAGLWLMAQPITRLLFQHGEFGLSAAHLTSRMIAVHGSGVWVFSALLMVNRAFYADGDQLTPMKQGVLCVVLNLVTGVTLLPVLHEQALPWATNLSAVAQLLFAVMSLRRRGLMVEWRGVLRVAWRTTAATIVMYAAGAQILQRLNHTAGGVGMRVLNVILPIAGCVAVFIASLFLLGCRTRDITGEHLTSGDGGQDRADR